LPASYRAVVIRNRADEWHLAVQQQHGRIQAFCRAVHAGGGLLSASRLELALGRTELEFFIVALRRLHRVGALIRRSQMPREPELVQALRSFDRLVRPVISLRNDQEHLDDATVHGRGGLGYGVGAAGVSVTHNGSMLDTLALSKAAAELHARIRAVVDPLAARDPHGADPIVDLPARSAAVPRPGDAGTLPQV
jgi:hypothetical protein